MPNSKRNGRRVWGALPAAAACLMFAPLADAVDERLSTEEIISRSQEANGFCRGYSGDDPETWAWCSVRGALDEVLTVRGYCYGKEGQAGFEMQWHKCTKDSIPGTPPKNPYE